MCDTLVSFGEDRSFLAKNSDRNPGEKQIIFISMDPAEEFYRNPYEEKVDKYVNNSFKTLKKIFNHFDNKYRALISKPVWIWGAEMGVNEFGLSIGNEAVFSKEKVDKRGLLGMDILRLALHNCRSAQEAVDFIIDLINEYGQGGDGGYSSTLKYHNSYMIKDFEEAYILETAAEHWAVKKVDELASISNAYTIRNDFFRIDSDADNIDNFKETYENKIKTYLSKGNYRQRFTEKYLKENPVSIDTMIKLLRSHLSKDNKIKRGMKSICVHPGWLIKSETTASMIVEYFEDEFLVWFTGSPNPCVSLYKPLVLGKENNKVLAEFADKNYVLDYCNRWEGLSERMMNDREYFYRTVKVLRDEKEKEIREKMQRAVLTGADTAAVCEECLDLAESFRKNICS